MIDGFDRKSYYSISGRVNSPRGEDMDRALLQTGLRIPQPRKAHQSKSTCPMPKTVLRSILIEITAIRLLQLLKL